MKKPTKKNSLIISLAQRIVALLEREGEMTTAQVVAHLGHHVSASQATRAWESFAARERKRQGKPFDPANCDPQKTGRTLVVRDRLRRLAQRGKISHLAPGLFGPLRSKNKKAL